MSIISPVAVCKMWSQASMKLCFVLALALSVSSTPIEERATPRCTARDVAIVKRTVIDPVFFCKWWQEDTRTRTPFLEFTVSEVNNLCACIAPESNVKSTKHKRAPLAEPSLLNKRSPTADACRKEMSLQFTEPWHFCNFYNAYPRTSSPFRKYATKDLIKLCNCVEGKVSMTTAKKTSIGTKKISSSTKKASVIKSSTSTKRNPTSTKKIAKSASKTLSSSIRIPSSTSSRKTSTSAIKKSSSSTLNPSTSTSTSLSSNVSEAPSSSTKKPSTPVSKQPAPASSTISVTPRCKPPPPRYPGGYGYIAWNSTNDMGNTMCGETAPATNRPARSYVLSVHQILPYEGNCIQLCLETDACQSWALDRSHTECTLYNAPTEEYLEALQTSYDGPQTNYYDANCYECSDTIIPLGCNTLSDSPPSGSSCGQLGLSSVNAGAASYGSQSDAETINNCAKICMSNLDCLSFSTDRRSNLCFFYTQTASTIANHYRGNTTEQTLYDVQCFQASDLNVGNCGHQKR
ncbi:hypothetical protein E4T48_04312 [Aureobasidium sp. EXF-10727]|nr:hypothetical protein E4T48_04312 [Aureobasidium sp. EXF-10727]